MSIPIPIPEVVVVGDFELLFVGLALGAGMPKAARKIVARKYGVGSSESEKSGEQRE
jgi:hypothetical protein